MNKNDFLIIDNKLLKKAQITTIEQKGSWIEITMMNGVEKNIEMDFDEFSNLLFEQQTHTGGNAGGAGKKKKTFKNGKWTTEKKFLTKDIDDDGTKIIYNNQDW